MKGIQRAPALLVPNISNVDILNGYEILGNEPMHDIAGHLEEPLRRNTSSSSKRTKTVIPEYFNARFEQRFKTGS